jgi:FtsH-binding integral membrane protein
VRPSARATSTARRATTLTNPSTADRPPDRIFESILVGSIASTYTTDSVVKALVATVVMTLALTLYAWQTRVDFTAMGGALLCLMIGVVMFGIWTAIFPSQAGQTAYCAAMAILFSFFIVYDTQMILGGKHHSHAFQTDEWVFAALNVYIDIIQLFLQLLRLFVSRGARRPRFARDSAHHNPTRNRNTNRQGTRNE